MISRRLYEHVRTHNWFAVAIDLLIVVIGVFIGIQVANWNAARIDNKRAHQYLERIRADLEADISNYRNSFVVWRQVQDYGSKAISYAETGDTGGLTQWELLLAFFQAGQVADFYATDATYDELKSAGELELVADIDLRDALAAYYTLATRDPVFTERPEYRRRIRRIIPLGYQKYIWANCWESGNTLRQTLKDCPAPASESFFANVVTSLRRDPALIADLRLWMSTMEVVSRVGNDRIRNAEQLRSSIDGLLLGSR